MCFDKFQSPGGNRVLFASNASEYLGYIGYIYVRVAGMKVGACGSAPQ